MYNWLNCIQLLW